MLAVHHTSPVSSSHRCHCHLNSNWHVVNWPMYAGGVPSSERTVQKKRAIEVGKAKGRRGYVVAVEEQS